MPACCPLHSCLDRVILAMTDEVEEREMCPAGKDTGRMGARAIDGVGATFKDHLLSSSPYSHFPVPSFASGMMISVVVGRVDGHGSGISTRNGECFEIGGLTGDASLTGGATPRDNGVVCVVI